MGNTDFVHLHVHSEYSILDGCGKQDDFIARAKEMGQRAIAFTEHGSIRGAYKLNEHANFIGGIKPIYGIEFYCARNHKIKGLARPQKDKIQAKCASKFEFKRALKAREQELGARKHITVLAKNNKGLSNLYKLSSIAWLDGYYIRPRIDLDLLDQYKDGLIILSGCMDGYISNAILNDDHKKAMELTLWFKERWGSDFYLEIMPNSLPQQKKINNGIARIHKKTGIKMVGTNDAHYILKSDWAAHDILLCVNTKKRLSDPNRWSFSIKEFWLQSRSEMLENFCNNHSESLSVKQIQNALDTTLEISDKCCARMDIDRFRALLPDLDIPEKYDGNDFTWVVDLCLGGWRERNIEFKAQQLAKRKGTTSKDVEDEYLTRLKYELKMIRGKKVHSYFLVIRDLQAWAKGKGIICGPGRGSAGGSLVSYLLNITDVDPIEHGLIFERFLNPARIDMPDIDLDFEDRRRAEVAAYLKRKYGSDKVCHISTITRMTGKSCLRDLGRVLEIPPGEVDSLTKSIVTRSSGDERASQTIADALDDSEIGRDFNSKYPDVLKYASRLEGQARGLGLHAAGVIVSGDKLVEWIPLETRDHNGQRVVCSAFDMYGAEAQGLMKIDVLGLRTLSVISDCLKSIEKRHGVNIDLDWIDLEDPKVLDQYTALNFCGIFQFDTTSAEKICEGVKFDRFEDITAMVALDRPGTARSGLATQYLKRKADPSKRVSIHPVIDKICEDTLGIIVYQEHVIKIFTDVAGFPPGTADSLRKKIAKKWGDETLGKERETFIKGAMARGFDKELASSLMDKITFFGCLHKGVKIATPCGPICIADLKSGDEILSSDDGRLVVNVVEEIRCTGRKEVFKMNTDVGSVLATKDHWWQKGDNSYAKTISLNIGDELSYPMSTKFTFGKGMQCKLPRVKSINYFGEVETWDLECENEPANYVIENGLISHNSYGFNKSHATAYAMISYRQMYLKTYYPLEFFWALLANEPDRARIMRLVREARAIGINVLSPDVNESGETFTISGDAIKAGLVDLKGVGVAAVASIVAHQPYESLIDFLQKVNARKVHKGVIASLVKAGALAKFIPNTKWFLDNLENIWSKKNRKNWHKYIEDKVNASKCMDDYSDEDRIFVAAEVSPLAFGEPPIKPYEDFLHNFKVDWTTTDGDEIWGLKWAWIYGIMIEVRYNQVGDFHSGSEPSKDEKKRMNWSAQYANINIEDATGNNKRVKVDWDTFETYRKIVDSGPGTPVAALVSVNKQWHSLKVRLLLDVSDLKHRVMSAKKMTIPQRMLADLSGFGISKRKDVTYALKTCRTGVVSGEGVVTSVRIKVDKNMNEMAFVAIYGRGGVFEFVIFAGTWCERLKSIMKCGNVVFVKAKTQNNSIFLNDAMLKKRHDL